MKENRFAALVRNLLLVTADCIAISGSVVLALLIYRCFGGSYKMVMFFRFWPFLTVFVLAGIFSRLYSSNFIYGGPGISAIEELKRITLIVAVGILFQFSYLALLHSVERISRVAALGSALLAVAFIPVLRHLVRLLMKKLHFGETNALFVGGGKTGKHLMDVLLDDVFYGVRPVGFFSCEAESSYRGIPCIGGVDDVLPALDKQPVPMLILAIPMESLPEDKQKYLEKVDHLLVIGDSGKMPMPWNYMLDLYGVPFLTISNRLRQKFFRVLKFTVELFFSLIAILLALVPGLVIALLVKITSRGPVFYYAERLGKNEKPFCCIKFRTMYRDADKKLHDLLESDPELKAQWDENFKLDDDPRITPLGKFLRHTSLDELPQFINVLRGEMSLIGPRPIVEAEKKYFGDSYQIISKVRPGITGLWQVSGRNSTSYEQRVFLNLYYLNNWSIWMDYYIFLATIREIVFPSGAK